MISSAALSTKTPEGVPSARRTMRPPGGSGVAAPIPAASRALLLTQTAWPSTRSATAGRSDTAASRSLASGNFWPAQRFWSQPRPCAQAPAGRPAALAAMRRAACDALAAPRRSAIVERFAEPLQMPVGVRPAREDEPSGQIQPSRVTRLRARLRRVSDEHDLSVAHENAGFFGPGVGRRVDRRPFEQQGRLGRRRRREQGEDQGRGESHDRILTAAARAPMGARSAAEAAASDRRTAASRGRNPPRPRAPRRRARGPGVPRSA